MSYTHKTVNGVDVPLTAAEIAELEERDRLWAERIAQKEAIRYIGQRQEAYPPIGDQLDALLKQFNYMRIQGQLDPATATMDDVVSRLNNYNNLVQDMDDIIAQWLAVKAQYPKPGP